MFRLIRVFALCMSNYSITHDVTQSFGFVHLYSEVFAVMPVKFSFI